MSELGLVYFLGSTAARKAARVCHCLAKKCPPRLERTHIEGVRISRRLRIFDTLCCSEKELSRLRLRPEICISGCNTAHCAHLPGALTDDRAGGHRGCSEALGDAVSVKRALARSPRS